MRATNADVSRFDGDSGRRFRSLQRLLHRQRRQIKVDDHALAPALRFRNSQPCNFQLSLRIRLADQGAGLHTAQVKSDNEVTLSRHDEFSAANLQPWLSGIQDELLGKRES